MENEKNYEINLTEEELNLLKKYVKHGEDFVNVNDKHTQDVYMSIIDKAEKLQNELDAIDEVMKEKDCDMLLWFYGKYEKLIPKDN